MRVCVLLSRQSHRQSGVITNHNLSLSARLMSTSISVDLHKTLHDQTSRSQEVWEVEVLIRIPNLGLAPSGLQPALIISGDYCNLTLGADQTEIPLKYNNWWLDTLQIQHVGLQTCPGTVQPRSSSHGEKKKGVSRSCHLSTRLGKTCTINHGGSSYQLTCRALFEGGGLKKSFTNSTDKKQSFSSRYVQQFNWMQTLGLNYHTLICDNSPKRSNWRIKFTRYTQQEQLPDLADLLLWQWPTRGKSVPRWLSCLCCIEHYQPP